MIGPAIDERVCQAGLSTHILWELGLWKCASASLQARFNEILTRKRELEGRLSD